jgi:hypothetical protein
LAVARCRLSADRNPESATFRELALSKHSLSAQQLADRLDESTRPSEAGLRGYLRSDDNALVYQVRGGGFAFGTFYKLKMLGAPVAITVRPSRQAASPISMHRQRSG